MIEQWMDRRIVDGQENNGWMGEQWMDRRILNEQVNIG